MIIASPLASLTVPMALRMRPTCELTAPLDQEDQEVHRQALEAHRLPVAPQLVGGDIELEAAEAIGSRKGGCQRTRSFSTQQ